MHAMPPRVTAAEFVRHFGEWQDRAAIGPIAITHHGRDRLVAMSATSYRALAEEAPSTVDAVLITHLSEGLIAFDAQLRVTALSRIAAACLGLTEADTVGGRLSLEPALSEQLERTVRTGEEGAFEAQSPTCAGRWLRYRCFPYQQGAACLLRDISDERTARRQRELEAGMADALAAHGSIGRASLSPRGVFIEIEPALAALMGFPVEALVRTRLVDLLALDRRTQALGHLEDVFNGGAARAFDSSLLVRSGGQRPARIALAGSDGGAIVVITTS